MQDLDSTLLFIAHDLSMVRYISDRMAVMYLGSLVEVGSSSEVFFDPKHPYTENATCLQSGGRPGIRTPAAINDHTGGNSFSGKRVGGLSLC